MKTFAKSVVVLLLFFGSCHHRPAVAGSTEFSFGPCVQGDFSASCPLEVDPNLLGVPILGPVVNDPNTWTIASMGEWNRVIETCDPDGQLVFVELLDSNCDDSNIVYNDQLAAWRLQVNCFPGVRWWLIRVTDVPDYGAPKAQEALIVVEVPVPENHSPAVAKALQKDFMRWCKRQDVDWTDRVGPAALDYITARINSIR